MRVPLFALEWLRLVLWFGMPPSCSHSSSCHCSWDLCSRNGPSLLPLWPRSLTSSRLSVLLHSLSSLYVIYALSLVMAYTLYQWFLELWDASHAVLGVITIVAVQRAIQKILIAVFLSREFKHDETNRAWWSGKWYGRGLGNSAMSQPAREFIVKIVEMSLWSSDFLLGHILLIILTVPIFIPFIDKLHSTMLCKWIQELI